MFDDIINTDYNESNETQTMIGSNKMTYYTEEKEYLVQCFSRDGTRCYNSIVKAKDKCSALLWAKRHRIIDRRLKLRWTVKTI